MKEHPIYKDYLNELLPTFPKNSIVFEFGINEMQDTVRLLKLLHNPQFYGFEPDYYHFNNAKYIAQKLDLNIVLINAAISNMSGSTNLYQSSLVDGTNPGCSSIRKPKNVLNIFPHVLFGDIQTVQTYSLDSFAKENNIDHIDFIWADIQGAEIDLVNGGQNILLKTDYLFVEYCNDELYEGQANLLALLKALPGKWEIIKDYKSDIFLKRNN